MSDNLTADEALDEFDAAEAQIVDGDFPVDLLTSWERALAEGVSSDAAFAGVQFPLQRRRELDVMVRLATEAKAHTVMEIGADKGGTLLHWCLVPTVRRVVACEIRGTPYAALFEKTFPHISFLWVNGSSLGKKPLRAVSYWLQGRPIDVLFIDGDKSYFDVDFKQYSPLVKTPGGLVFMHDIQDRVTRHAFDKCKNKGAGWCRMVDTTESLEAVARERAGIPNASQHEDWLRHWKGESCGVGVIWI